MKTIHKGGIRPNLIRTNHDIRLAVQTWLGDRTQAEQIYGHIKDWDTRQVTDMSHLFHSTGYVDDDDDLSGIYNDFNDDISKWDVSIVTNMNYMFSKTNKFNQRLDKWNVSNVVTMRGMFDFAVAFNQPINNWDVSNVRNMESMFHFATKFNQPLNKWNVSRVQNMNWMFMNATSFNQPIGNWKFRSGVEMESMFSLAESFNQDLTSWDGIEPYYPYGDGEDIFEGSAMTKVNYPTIGITMRQKITKKNKEGFNTLLSASRKYSNKKKDDPKCITREKALSIMEEIIKAEVAQGKNPYYTKFGGKNKKKTKKRKSLKKKQSKTKRKSYK